MYYPCVAGYDTHPPRGGSSLPADPLSARRELVEQLDSEPVFGYLEQNGVLEAEEVEEIKKESSPAKVVRHFSPDFEIFSSATGKGKKLGEFFQGHLVLSVSVH